MTPKKTKILNNACSKPENHLTRLRIFCSLCQATGYDIKIGELMAIGQDSNDAKLRSVNGGGVNPIDGWDDAYEQFFMTLLWT